MLCSPHTRGCSSFPRHPDPSSFVFPAFEGVFLKLVDGGYISYSVPRIRGGVPAPERFPIARARCSPHTRGCSVLKGIIQFITGVFPAYAGVFRCVHSVSLRQAGVPRIRGGVPTEYTTSTSADTFSPHTRGCSCPIFGSEAGIDVFPAYAGVFLSVSQRMRRHLSVPRIRGGVPG